MSRSIDGNKGFCAGEIKGAEMCWKERECVTGVGRWISAGLWVAMLATGVSSGVRAAEVVQGQRGQATMRAVVNFRGLAELERTHGLTNRTQIAIPSPMPLPLRTNEPPEGGGGLRAASVAAEGTLVPAALPLPPSPPPVANFLALEDDDTRIPPDTHGAVGPNHLMTTLNTQVRIQDRSGNNISTVSLNTFWQTVGAPLAFDPKVLYDPYGQRWMFTAMADALNQRSAVLMAVSQTDDPTGNWFLYRIDADPLDISWADYPSMGFNKDWIVVSVNMFPTFLGGPTGLDFTGVNLYVFNKTNLYANGTGQFTLLRDGSTVGFTIVPTITYDAQHPVMHLVEVDNLFHSFTTTSRRLRMSTITGPVGAEVMTLGAAFTTDTNEWGAAEPFASTFFLGGFAPQAGSQFLIANNDSRIQNVVYRNGSLWCTHHVFLPASLPTHTAVQWWQLATNGTSIQFGRIEDTSGATFYAFPSITVNRNDDALIGFSRFSGNQFASGNYAYRSCFDPANTFRTDFVLKDGEGPYYKTFSSTNFFAENRWGDYSGTVMDPLNDLDMWTIQEYAAAPDLTAAVGFQGRWGTWWGKVSPVETCEKIEFTATQSFVNEATPGFATISVLNIGGAPGTVDFATSDGSAIAGEDYLTRTGTLTFAAGQTETNFIVVILDNAVVNSNKTVNLTLFNASGPAVLGRVTNAVLVIEDDETLAIPTQAGEFNFSSYLNNGAFYIASEYETSIAPCGRAVFTILNPPDRSARGALITVVRTNGNRGRVMVDYATAEGGSALPFVDYIPVQGTLVFDDYQNSTNFHVEVLPDFSLISTSLFSVTRFIRVVLSNPRPAPEEELERPGLVRPRLGLGNESGILVYTVIPDTVAFEQKVRRFDEYPSANDVGGGREVHIQVIKKPSLTPIGGNVRFRTREFEPNSRYIIDRSALQPGSDFAEAPSPGGLSGVSVWPNPTLTDPALIRITNYSDYLSVNEILQWDSMECRKNIVIVFTNDSTVEFNEDIMFILEPIPGEMLGVTPLGSLGNVTLLFDDQPAGAVDREWNPYNIAPTDPPFNRTPGANNTVRALAAQPDGKTILGGDFTHVNAERKPGIARMGTNGVVDRTFDPGEGVNGFVAALVLYPTNALEADRILVGGGFTAYNGAQRNGIARVLPNGQLDTTFDPGNGANGPVWSIALQTDGRILVAGSFTEFNDFPRSGVARLHSDGALDLTFDPGTGADATVWAVDISRDAVAGDQIFLGGDFLFFNGDFRAGVVRLNSDGSVDPNFETGGGVVGSVFALAVQTNNAVLVAGSFTEIDARPRNSIARFNPDGSLDLNFDPGFGPDGPILALTLQPDGKALIGGPFTRYNGTRRLGYARLRLDGTLDTSFLDTGYNQFAGLVNTFSFEEPKYVAAIAVQADGNIMIGGSFTNIGGNPSIRTPLRNDWTVFTRADKQVRFNIARVWGGATPGPGNAEFESPEYFVDENADLVSVQLQRSDGRLGGLIAFAEASDRIATNGLDYTVTNRLNLWREGNQTPPVDDSAAPVSVGQVSPAFFRIPILNDTLQEGDETVDLSFLRPDGSITLGGEFIPLGGALGRAKAVLSIADDDVDHGIFHFVTDNYFTNETAGFARISVIRTNGASGPVTVRFFTRNSTNTPIAEANRDYRPVSQTLFFSSGEVRKEVSIPIIYTNLVEFDENVELVLTNATGGAKLPGGRPNSIAVSTLTIIDGDFPPGRLNFESATFATNEDSGLVIISVRRAGGNFGAVSVQYTTADGTATSPADYAATSGRLDWDSGESGVKSFTIPLVADGIVDGGPTETINIRLFSPLLGTTAETNLLGFRTNATVVIAESDAYGLLAFNQSFYQADENGGSATITVVRRSGVAGMVSVDYSVTPVDPLSAAGDYVPTGGTLAFLPGESSKSFTITLLDDTDTDGNKDLILTLLNPVNGLLGTPNPVTLTLVDNESFNIRAGEPDLSFRDDTQVNGPIFGLGLQPDGRLVLAGDFTEVNNVIRLGVARLESDGRLDASLNPGVGPNGSVRVVTIQPDSKILLGGFFTRYNGTNRGAITRVNADGAIDTTFNPGAGANNPVFGIALQPDDRVLVAGGFSTFNSIPRPGIVRLNTNGTVDLTFNPGAGANNTIFAVALQSDGKVVIGGDFTAFDGQPRIRLARMNRNGSLDLGFNPGVTLDAAVRAILVQPDGKIVVAGSFTSVNGVARNYVARLNSDGTLDTGFLASPLAGADSAIFAMAQQVDGKLVLAGDFRLFNGVTRSRLTRVNPDGSNDATINFGGGTDSFISALVLQPDRRIVIGGDFTTYDGLPRQRIARIHGGSFAGSGVIEFVRAEYLIDENATNALITVRRRFGTTGAVGVDFRTVDDTALAGQHYQSTSGTLNFPEAETRESFLVPIIDNAGADGDRRLILELIGGSFTGGAASGPQPIARLVILDNEGTISFSATDYNVGENVASGFATIPVLRSGATNQTVSVNFATASGSATALADYFPTNGTLTFLPGETAKNFQVRFVNDAAPEPHETILLSLSNPTGSNVLGIATATLLIAEDDFAIGQLVFSSTGYLTNENATNAVITVLRTNGNSGFVTVRYRTSDNTALAGQDYVGTNGILAFADGETAKTFEIRLMEDLLVETPETINLALFEPIGGATIGVPGMATLTISDNDMSFVVAVGSALVSESGPENGVIDPGETVTMALTLRNNGSGNTPSLVGTLLPGSGVTAPSGPQTYGVLIAGGDSEPRDFTFTAAGNSGDRLVATLLLTAGASTNGFVSFFFTLGGEASRTFASTDPIVINDNTTATPYPSGISVLGMGGQITRVTITLSNFTHSFPDDVDILLVGPTGEKATLMSDAGGSLAVSNATITFSDTALNVLPDAGPILPGSYVPANYAGAGTGDTFPAPAPGLPYTSSALSIFNTLSPNGTWDLFVVDDDVGVSGRIAGWSLNIQTSDPVGAVANMLVSASVDPNPVMLGNPFSSTIMVSNLGPATASNVGLSDVMPASLHFVSANASGGTMRHVADTLVWNVPSLPKNASATLTIVATPMATGTIVNSVAVGADQPDLSLSDNTATMIMTVVEPPGLTVTRQGDVLRLAWPASTGFILQAADALSPLNWADAGITPQVVGGQNIVNVNLDGGHRFFRLRAP